MRIEEYYLIQKGNSEILARTVLDKIDNINVLSLMLYDIDKRDWYWDFDWEWDVLYGDFSDYKIITEQEAMAYLQSTI